MKIQLLKCYQCWSFTDDRLIDTGVYAACSCGCKYVRPVNPTKLAVATYLIQNFKHFCSLLLIEIREKFRWKKASQ